MVDIEHRIGKDDLVRDRKVKDESDVDVLGENKDDIIGEKEEMVEVKDTNMEIEIANEIEFENVPKKGVLKIKNICRVLRILKMKILRKS